MPKELVQLVFMRQISIITRESSTCIVAISITLIYYMQTLAISE
jgi:hypothetical protein